MHRRAVSLLHHGIERLHCIVHKRDPSLGHPERRSKRLQCRNLLLLAADKEDVLRGQPIASDDEIALAFLLVVLSDRAGKDLARPFLLDEPLELRNRTDMGIGMLRQHIALPVFIRAGRMAELAELVRGKHPIDIEDDDGRRLHEVIEDV